MWCGDGSERRIADTDSVSSRGSSSTIAGRPARSLIERALATKLYARTLRVEAPSSLRCHPVDPTPGDPDFANALFQGRYVFLGEQQTALNEPPWSLQGASDTWQAEVNAFEWLADFRATEAETARLRARELVRSWIDLKRSMACPILAPGRPGSAPRLLGVPHGIHLPWRRPDVSPGVPGQLLRSGPPSLARHGNSIVRLLGPAGDRRPVGGPGSADGRRRAALERASGPPAADRPGSVARRHSRVPKSRPGARRVATSPDCPHRFGKHRSGLAGRLDGRDQAGRPRHEIVPARRRGLRQLQRRCRERSRVHRWRSRCCKGARRDAVYTVRRRIPPDVGGQDVGVVRRRYGPARHSHHVCRTLELRTQRGPRPGHRELRYPRRAPMARGG